MARQREHAVVRLRVELDHARAERARRTARRARRATRSLAGSGVRNQVAPSKRSGVARVGPPVAPPASGWPGTSRSSSIAGGEPALRRADVGHGRLGGRRGEHLAHRLRQRADGNRDDDELDARDRFGERARAVVERLRAGRLAERRGVGVPAGDPSDAGPLRREGDGGAEEAGADDRERGHGRQRPAGLGRAAARGSPRSSCFITSSTAANIVWTPRSDKGPAFAALSSRRSSASRAASISGAPVSRLCSLTRRTSSRRRFRASRTARSSCPISSRRRRRSSIQGSFSTSPAASVLSCA